MRNHILRNIVKKAGFAKTPKTANSKRHRERIRRHRGKTEPKKPKKRGGEASSHQMRSLERSYFSGARPKRGGAGRGGHAWEGRCGEGRTGAEPSRVLHLNLTTQRSRPPTYTGMYYKTQRLNRTPTAPLRTNPGNVQTCIHAKP